MRKAKSFSLPIATSSAKVVTFPGTSKQISLRAAVAPDFPGAVIPYGWIVETLRDGGLGIMAKTKKDGFIIYKSFYPALKNLTDAQMGRLFRMIYEYQVSGTTPAPDSDLAVYFAFFKAKFDEDEAKYEDVCAKREANIRKRWDAEKNTKQ